MRNNHPIIGLAVLASLLLFLLAVSARSASAEPTRREAAGEGFHLDLVTDVNIERRGDSGEECDVRLVESFPSGAFLDVDQVRELERFGGLQGAKVRLEAPFIDIEKPMELSAPFDFEVYMGKQTPMQRRASIPFHLRYHRPNPKGKAVVEIKPPLVCSTCALIGFETTSKGEAACKSRFGSEFSAYKALYGPLAKEVVVKVPVGNPHDLSAITISTVVVVILGTLMVVHSALVTSKRAQPKSLVM